MSNEELLNLVDSAPEWSGKPFTTAPEIAGEVDMTRQGVHNKLEQLVQEDRVRKYTAGQSAIYWTESAAERKGCN